MSIFDNAYPPDMPSRFSVSFLGSAGECVLKAKMQREGNDGGGPLATIGKLAHEIFAACEFWAQLAGEAKVPPNLALDIADNVMKNSEEPSPLSVSTYRTVLGMVDTWASRTIFPVEADVWVIEHPFRRPLTDPETGFTYIISGRMDEVAIWGSHYRNRDWKTGPGLPTQKAVEEDHTQLPFYWWEAAQQWPGLETAECTEFYSRYGAPRPVHLSTRDLGWIENYILTACRRLHTAYATRNFPLQSGPWCRTSCPNREACPLPDYVKGGVTSDVEAINTIQAIHVEEARTAKRKEWVKEYLLGTPTGTVMEGGKERGHIKTTKRKLDEKRLSALLAEHGLTKNDLYNEEPSTEFKVS